MKATNVTIEEKTLELTWAGATSSGHGHKKITVELNYIDEDNNDHKKEFSATTNNMPNYDDATDLEGEEKRKALYEIIEFDIRDEVIEWLEDIKLTHT